MGTMKNNITNVLRLLGKLALGLTLLMGVVNAQQPSPSPVPVPAPKKAEAKPQSTPVVANLDAGGDGVVTSIFAGFHRCTLRLGFSLLWRRHRHR